MIEVRAMRGEPPRGRICLFLACPQEGDRRGVETGLEAPGQSRVEVRDRGAEQLQGHDGRHGEETREKRVLDQILPLLTPEESLGEAGDALGGKHGQVPGPRKSKFQPARYPLQRPCPATKARVPPDSTPRKQRADGLSASESSVLQAGDCRKRSWPSFSLTPGGAGH